MTEEIGARTAFLRVHPGVIHLHLGEPHLITGMDLAGGRHAVEHACIGMLPFFGKCDREDIGGPSAPTHPDTGQSQLFIYDGDPGGVGSSRQGYVVVEALWRRTRDLIRDCRCAEGPDLRAIARAAATRLPWTRSLPCAFSPACWTDEGVMAVLAAGRMRSIM